MRESPVTAACMLALSLVALAAGQAAKRSRSSTTVQVQLQLQQQQQQKQQQQQHQQHEPKHQGDQHHHQKPQQQQQQRQQPQKQQSQPKEQPQQLQQQQQQQQKQKDQGQPQVPQQLPQPQQTQKDQGQPQVPPQLQQLQQQPPNQQPQQQQPAQQNDPLQQQQPQQQQPRVQENDQAEQHQQLQQRLQSLDQEEFQTDRDESTQPSTGQSLLKPQQQQQQYYQQKPQKQLQQQFQQQTRQQLPTTVLDQENPARNSSGYVRGCSQAFPNKEFWTTFLASYVPGLCTHLSIEYAYDLNRITKEHRADTHYRKQLKALDPDIKILAGFGIVPNDEIVEQLNYIKRNLKATTSHLRQNGFDGIQVLLSFPDRRSNSDRNQIAPVASAIMELGDVINQRPTSNRLTLIALDEGSLVDSEDVAILAGGLDFIFLSISGFSHWAKGTALDSPLFPPADISPDSIYEGFLARDGTESMRLEKIRQMSVAKGVPASKLVIGIPTVSVGFTLAHPEENGIGASVKTGQVFSRPTGLIRSPGFASNFEICQISQNATSQFRFSKEQQGAYVSQGDQWFNWDGNASGVSAKIKFVKENGLAGAFIDDIGSDRFACPCDNNRRFAMAVQLQSELKG